jgi:hypothetical protein
MVEEPKELEVAGIVDTCPACGYRNGFHVSFNAGESGTEIILICPSCGSRFRTGWQIGKLQGR